MIELQRAFNRAVADKRINWVDGEPNWDFIYADVELAMGTSLPESFDAELGILIDEWYDRTEQY